MFSLYSNWITMEHHKTWISEWPKKEWFQYGNARRSNYMSKPERNKNKKWTWKWLKSTCSILAYWYCSLLYDYCTIFLRLPDWSKLLYVSQNSLATINIGPIIYILQKIFSLIGDSAPFTLFLDSEECSIRQLIACHNEEECFWSSQGLKNEFIYLITWDHYLNSCTLRGSILIHLRQNPSVNKDLLMRILNFDVHMYVCMKSCYCIIWPKKN